MLINLIIPTHLLDPEALGKNDLIVLDDGDGHAGHLPVLLGLLGVVLKVGQNLFELLGVRLCHRFSLGLDRENPACGQEGQEGEYDEKPCGTMAGLSGKMGHRFILPGQKVRVMALRYNHELCRCPGYNGEN